MIEPIAVKLLDLVKRKHVAQCIHELATHVENGHLTKLSLEWNGGETIETKFMLQQPAESITLTFDPTALDAAIAAHDKRATE